MDHITIIIDSLDALAENAGSVFVALAAAGSIAMATVQLVKELTPLRRNRQRLWLEAWLRERSRRLSEIYSEHDINFTEAYDDLILLSTGGNRDALFELPMDDLITQINLAAQIVIDSPNRYRDLFIILSYGVEGPDLKVLFKGLPPPPNSAEIYFDTKNKISRIIQRGLDGVRISLNNRWKYLMNVLSISVTMIVVFVAVGLKLSSGTDADLKFSIVTLLFTIPFAAIGGYFAPITRDLLAVIQGLRK